MLASSSHRIAPEDDAGSTSSSCITCYEDVGSLASSRFCSLECKALSKVFTRRLERVVASTQDEEILDVSEEDSQYYVNLLLHALQFPRFKGHRRKVHRLLVRLSLKYNILPASLFLPGVECSDVECHGSGSFADIYLGDYHGSKVALKRLRMFQMIDESKREQLKRAFHHESLIWRGLDHQHVLAFLGVDNNVFKRNPCMVLPWMGLGNVGHATTHLTQVVSASDMIFQILTWIHEITLGLAYLHAEGVVHGDLRGPNILIDVDRTAKLADFGLAVFAEGASRNYGSTRGGNARWLAPELIYPELFGLTSDRPTCASDVFALGCVCVELCTAQAPYRGVSDNQVIARVPLGLRPERPEFLGRTAIPDTLWSTITLCWNKEASHRPMASALVEATKGLPTQRQITPPYFEDPLNSVSPPATDEVIGTPTREDDSKIGGGSAMITGTERSSVVERSLSEATPFEAHPGSRRRNARSSSREPASSSTHLLPYPSPTASPPPTGSLSRTHPRPTTWKCPAYNCGLTFPRQLQLKYHLRSHRDERLFQCCHAGCKKIFKNEQICVRHEESHRSDLITCGGCKRDFLTAASLDNHLRSEMGVECNKYQHRNLFLSNPGSQEDIVARELPFGCSEVSP